MTHRLVIKTPIGPLTIVASDRAITAIRFGADTLSDDASATALLREAEQQLCEYFAGSRRDFSLPLEPAGTPFQQAVWQALQTIPYGHTRTYGQIAVQIGHHKSYRAVGMANNRNPLPIVIPCHRVVGADGKLTGYAGGLDTKELLLSIESGVKIPHK